MSKSIKKPLQIDPERMRSVVERHRAEPHITTDRYVRSRRIELGEMVLQRERVYLDLNYWLRLRDIVLARRSDRDLADLLTALRRSVQEKRRICPISESTFLELLKQQDPRTRMASAKLIDDLSEGVSLAPFEERMATEVAHLLLAALGRDVVPVRQLAWSKLSYILGVVHPVVDGLDAATQRVQQKAFFDHMWDIALVDMVPMLDVDHMQKIDMEDIADRLNELNAKNATSMKTFRQVYEHEFIGAPDSAADIGQQVIEQLWMESDSQATAPTEEQRIESRQQVFGLLRSMFTQRRNCIVQALPSLQIGALCHAAVRWDQKRKLTGNDLFDFHHAQAALPYCNVFLTEKPLHTLLHQKHVSVGDHFACRVISSVDEAVSLLR